MNLEERIRDFKYVVACELYEENREMVLDFSSYWTEHSLNAKKFRAEKEKVFDIKRRFNTWKKNQQKWFPEKKCKIQTLLENYEIAKNNL